MASPAHVPRTQSPDRTSLPVSGAGSAESAADLDDTAIEEASEEDVSISPNEFDLMISRSVQSSGPVLESEAVEHSMLRGPRRYSHSTAAPAHERTPLLQDDSVEAGHGDGQDETSKSPFLGGISRSRFWIIFSILLATQFVANFDGTIMASSHPAITSYFNSSNSASWLSTAFLLTSSAFQPLLGSLSDTTGRKPPYVATLIIFTISTIWCALAGSMTSLVLARALCGLGAGGMMMMGVIILSDMVPIEIRGSYQSYINVTYGAGSMLGAALGGAMVDSLGWRWEFGVQVPALVLCVVVAVVAIPNDIGLHDKKKESFRDGLATFDIRGSVFVALSLTSLILGLSLGGNVLPWSHPIVITSLVLFAVCFPIFLHAESIAQRPIMPLRFLRHSPHMNILISNMIACVVLNAIFFNLPLYFQAVLLTSATTSGLRLIIITLVASACGTATGFLITWTRRLKWAMVLGAVSFVIGCVCLASMRRGWPAAAYLVCMVPGAVGQGFQFPGSFMAILAITEQVDMAVITSTLVLWRSIGMVLGVAASSLVVQNSLALFLDKYVQGPDKAGVIERVRESVESIRSLPAEYQSQVVASYEAALHLTFLCCIGLSIVGLLLVLPVRLPRLGARK